MLSIVPLENRHQKVLFLVKENSYALRFYCPNQLPDAVNTIYFQLDIVIWLNFQHNSNVNK
jgi:hypothetical protein